MPLALVRRTPVIQSADSQAFSCVYEGDGGRYQIVVSRIGADVYAYAPNYGCWPGSWSIGGYPPSQEWLEHEMLGTKNKVDRRNCARGFRDAFELLVAMRPIGGAS